MVPGDAHGPRPRPESHGRSRGPGMPSHAVQRTRVGTCGLLSVMGRRGCPRDLIPDDPVFAVKATPSSPKGAGPSQGPWIGPRALGHGARVALHSGPSLAPLALRAPRPGSGPCERVHPPPNPPAPDENAPGPGRRRGTPPRCGRQDPPAEAEGLPAVAHPPGPEGTDGPPTTDGPKPTARRRGRRRVHASSKKGVPLRGLRALLREERDAWPRRRPGAWTPRDGAGSPPLTGPVAWGWRTSVRPYVRVARPAFETPRPGRGRRPGRRPGDSNPPDDASSRAPWGHAAASGRRRSSQGEV